MMLICDWCYKPAPKPEEPNQFQEVRFLIRDLVPRSVFDEPKQPDQLWRAELCPTCINCIREALDAQLSPQVLADQRQHVERRKQPHKFMPKKEPEPKELDA